MCVIPYTCCSLCQTVSRGQSYPPKLSGVQWFWMTGVLKGFQTRNVSMNLSGAWTNNSERVWITYTPLLVLSCWKLGHRDSILNCLEHYNWFEPIFGSLIFRFISVRWIGMQNLPYRRHFSTHLLKTTLFGGSRPTAAVLCPWARHFTPWKYWLITQEAVAPSRYDWKNVDWDVKLQHKLFYIFFLFFYKAKTCLRSREVLFSQPLCIFFLANSAHSFSHVKIFFLYLGH